MAATALAETGSSVWLINRARSVQVERFESSCGAALSPLLQGCEYLSRARVPIERSSVGVESINKSEPFSRVHSRALVHMPFEGPPTMQAQFRSSRRAIIDQTFKDIARFLDEDGMKAL